RLPVRTGAVTLIRRRPRAWTLGHRSRPPDPRSGMPPPVRVKVGRRRRLRTAPVLVAARRRDAGGGGAGVVPARVVVQETTAVGRGLRRPRVVRRPVATAVPPAGPAGAEALPGANVGVVREASVGATGGAMAAPAVPASVGAVRAVSAAAVREESAADGVSRAAIVGRGRGAAGDRGPRRGEGGGPRRSDDGGVRTGAPRPPAHSLRLEVGGRGVELHCDTCELIVTHLAGPQVRRAVEEAHRRHLGTITWESGWF